MESLSETAAQIRQRRGASAKWTEYPSEALPAWVADMDFLPPDPVIETLQRLVGAGDLGYPAKGLAEGYRKAYSQWSLAHFGVDSDSLILLPDVVTGLFLAMRTLVEPHSSIALLTPSYPPFYASIRENGLEVEAVPLIVSREGYQIDFERLGASFAKPEVTAFILCSPHNPTGRAWTRGELEEISRLSDTYGVQVVSDEIHQDIRFPGVGHIPFHSLGTDAAERSVVISAATKTFNLAGLKVAHMHSSSRAVRGRLLAFPEHLRGQATGIGLLAAATAYELGDPWLKGILTTLQGNRDRIDQWVHSTPAVKGYAPDATYLYWLEFPFDNAAARILDRVSIALSPGTDYEPSADKFVRLNYATYPDVLEEILMGLDQMISES